MEEIEVIEPDITDKDTDDNLADLLGQLTDDDMALVNDYSKYLDEFKLKALEKFVKGRIEHADQNPLSLDLQKEIENEAIDIISYQYLLTKK